jgi:thioredoxin 1
MAEIEITEQNFQNEVLNSSLPVVVDFWAPWCGPCKMIAPIIDEIAREYETKIKVGKMNTDQNLEIAGKYQITSIPTIIIFKNGKPAERIVGFRSKNDLKKVIDNVIM